MLCYAQKFLRHTVCLIAEYDEHGATQICREIRGCPCIACGCKECKPLMLCKVNQFLCRDFEGKRHMKEGTHRRTHDL